MKNFTIFESTIIGFFVGVIVSAYVTFVTGFEGYIGQMLNWITLTPMLKMIEVQDDMLIIVSFVFYILVFTIYGLIIGTIIRKSMKLHVVALVVFILLVVGITFDQRAGANIMSSAEVSNIVQVASVIRPNKALPKQYFGNESFGDLNGDNKDDVVFALSRDDEERGTLYYLSSAIATTSGYVGTNIIFLGNKVEPTGINIQDGFIKIDYIDHSKPTSTTTNILYAGVSNGKLSAIEKSEVDLYYSILNEVNTGVSTSTSQANP